MLYLTKRAIIHLPLPAAYIFPHICPHICMPTQNSGPGARMRPSMAMMDSNFLVVYGGFTQTVRHIQPLYL